jgi:MFS family permease
MQNLEARTIGKVSRRLIPFLIICYFVAYLDRVNVGFAALTMNKALGLTATMFGFGSGVFFLTYFIFEVPSNLFLDRFGARKWIARIMISWGILSGLMAAIPAIARATGLGDETTFYVIRSLLGVAEAGFFPGIIFSSPTVHTERARWVGVFMAAIPCLHISGPLSGLILDTFDITGPAAGNGVCGRGARRARRLWVFSYLTDRPREAAWLERKACRPPGDSTTSEKP